MNQKNSQFILHLRFVFMSLTSTADFQFPLEEPLDGRLFTRRKDLTNNIRLLIGTNGLHAILNGTWGTITVTSHYPQVAAARIKSGNGGILLSPSNLSLSCLLYTSPSPRDRTRSRMPSSA